MSAAEAQPPSQPPGSDPSRNAPPAKPMFNSWTENKKIKTCKCTVCDQRVRHSSQKCDRCGRHVCSECLDPSSSKPQFYKEAARNRIEVGCWACNWRSNMNPAFAHRKPAPEIRTEEERRARASKALGARRKAAANATRSKLRACNTNDDDDDVASIPKPGADLEPADGEYPGEQVSETTTRNVGQRAGIKRKRYTEEDSDVETYDQTEPEHVDKTAVRQMSQWVANGGFSKTRVQASSSTFAKKTAGSPEISPRADTFQQSTKSSIAPHLENGNTVIIGAGIVGLFITYQLALELQAAGIKHPITVVEIREQCSELASGMCLGILSTSGIPELWSQIANEAEESWQDILSSPDFPRKADLGTDTVFNVREHGAFGKEKMPSWFNGSSCHSLLIDKECFSRIDSISVAEWLCEQCKALGVSFLFSHSAYNTEFAAGSALTHVYVEDEGGERFKVQCNNLVLAAGPFTTGIFNSLFGAHAEVQLENHVKGAHCLHVTLNSKPEGDGVVLRLPNAMKDDDTLENEVNAVLFDPNKHVTLSALSSRTSSLDLNREHARNPKRSRTSALRKVATTYLNHRGADIQDRTKFPDRGRSELSTANRYNPILDKVPASGLGLANNDRDDLNPCGVWLCYGFGSHGTTLAPGAARILVSRMFHGDNGLDNYDFSLPEYSTGGIVGKGKGKARA